MQKSATIALILTLLLSFILLMTYLFYRLGTYPKRYRPAVMPPAAALSLAANKGGGGGGDANNQQWPAANGNGNANANANGNGGAGGWLGGGLGPHQVQPGP
ncbi:hypothetical protein AJ79_03993 [Helicocarpus griseus UAMH5409]|uniref:Uncharacterized protein n=1 Tax=Helicocarpus griseus UAMH5409 TaxID=1447875 RepID=A0A2B7XVS8_9EURO|nr:hypothetical protein AJ79_03993 [Helicocarpus griseus UAMH5409]